MPSQVLDLENHMCVEAITPWMPYLYTMSFNPVQPPPIINNSSDENEFKLHWSKNFQFTNGLPGCEDYYLSSLREDPEDKYVGHILSYMTMTDFFRQMANALLDSIFQILCVSERILINSWKRI